MAHDPGLDKQVDLVIYDKGVRTVVGKAIVSANGHIEAQVYRSVVPEIREGILNNPLECQVSISRRPTGLPTLPYAIPEGTGKIAQTTIITTTTDTVI